MKMVLWRVLAGALVLLSVVLAATACERGFAKSVVYENRTGKEIAVYTKYSDGDKYGNVPEFVIAAGRTEEYVSIVGYPKLFYEARDKDGSVVFRVITTPQELEKAGWHLVIGDQGTTATPERPAASP